MALPMMTKEIALGEFQAKDRLVSPIEQYTVDTATFDQAQL